MNKKILLSTILAGYVGSIAAVCYISPERQRFTHVTIVAEPEDTIYYRKRVDKAWQPFASGQQNLTRRLEPAEYYFRSEREGYQPYEAGVFDCTGLDAKIVLTRENWAKKE